MKKLPHLTALFLCWLFTLAFLTSCRNIQSADSDDVESDSVYLANQRDPRFALHGLSISDGLEVHVVATEPMLKNPTNIDVDDKGRIWVTEAYNYRPGINGNPVNASGDRILILEDLDHDGVADTAKVFYQGPEINSPIGICVLDHRVIVSQSPYVWIFYDDDGDDRADRKEILFQGIGGEQHDHGVHSFTFGPDGKLYFNFGNEGLTLKDKRGNVVKDQDGDPIGPGKYQMGMVFRCNLDGTEVECLGHNFRNNFELAVDSYGSIWQSDNDDDGNRSTRINYVMQYGNYGYRDEMTGAGWQASRTNMEDSIPLKHWHLNDPGVVPNLLQTGAGSPSGIMVYEGSLLPAAFRNQMIHCDPGPNVVRSYPVRKKGAGFEADTMNMIRGEKDQWFRPIDVCAAPDGSLIIADWYDPGVGGHQAGDQQKGRIYRVAPKGYTYAKTIYDYSTPANAVKALQNPNLNVRFKAYTALRSMGLQARDELEKLWLNHADDRMKARAFWLLVKMDSANQTYFSQALTNVNPDLRITALRALHQDGRDLIPYISRLVNDDDAHVRRECAIMLRHNKAPEAAFLWSKLAVQHNGKDRWYLEALGIGANRQWEPFLTSYRQHVGDPLATAPGRDIIWRSRAGSSVLLLAQLASANQEPLQNRLRYFRAFDFQPGREKDQVLIDMLKANSSDFTLKKLILEHLNQSAITNSALARQAVREVLDSMPVNEAYLQMVDKFSVRQELDKVRQIALTDPGDNLSVKASALLLKLGGSPTVREILNQKNSDNPRRLLRALGRSGSGQSIDILQEVALGGRYPDSLRQLAASVIGHSWSGEERVLELLNSRKVPAKLVPAMVESVKNAWRKSVYQDARRFLPGESSTIASRKAADIKTLLALKPNLSNGKKIFALNCSICHKVGASGYAFGPDLTQIGSKLPAEAQYDAIINPSNGISFGYEGWELKLKDGSTLAGIIASRTETEIELRAPGGQVQRINTNNVLSSKQISKSMMPEGLHMAMSEQELADLIAYLVSLK